MAESNEKPTVIRKVKKTKGGGHHGGAWKVAYADFTTAMMAFFMLLWLLNVSDKETLEGLADYFSPTAPSVSGRSGAGKPLAGAAMDTTGSVGAGAVVKIQAPPTASTDEQTVARAEDSAAEPEGSFAKKDNQQSDKALAALEDQLRQAIQQSPELTRHQDQILIEQTPDGVRIQLIDRDGRSMFRENTAQLYGYAERLVREIGIIAARLPNRVAILGHTDAKAFRGPTDYTNWELSADRANTARRVLGQAGVTADRFSEVTGKAATDPLYPNSPLRAENRRIAITVLREAPVVAPGAGSR